MSAAEWQRAGMLYLPIMAAVLAGLVAERRPRRFAGCLLSLLWVTASLVGVARLNELAHWWSFAPSEVVFAGMPLELYLGWVVLWGVVPQFAPPRLVVVGIAALMVVLDLVAMPACGAVVRLGAHWLVGEGVAAVTVLLPALCLGRWTLEQRFLKARAALQVATAALLFLYFLPELAFALRPGRGWAPLLETAGWVRQFELQGIWLLSLPGLAAVLEFAQRGLGTPIPYDPPQRLVMSGVYRYCANPMQVSCTVVLLAWAGMLRNGWLVLAAVVSAVYSAGIAAWDEGADLEQRFGMAWVAYRTQVHNWLPRWRPFATGAPAVVYLARGCGPCSELRQWIERQHPVGLRIEDAETLGPGAISRMRYEPWDGSAAVDGVRALGRVLEHVHLGWALAGAALRLPGVWQGVQAVMDVSGLGPRWVEG